MENKCRIDKWLWAVRLFKTRSIAADAVGTGKVKVNDQPVKASYLITTGKVITIRKGMVRYQFRVTGLIEKRVGAPLVKDYYEDITPQEELDKLEAAKMMPGTFRDKGLGRPTKKERRDLDEWMDAD